LTISHGWPEANEPGPPAGISAQPAVTGAGECDVRRRSPSHWLKARAVQVGMIARDGVTENRGIVWGEVQKGA